VADVTDVELMAYVDGELSPDRVRLVEVAIAADPGVRARLQRFVVTRAPVARAFDTIMTAPLPEDLLEKVRNGSVAGSREFERAEVVPFERRRDHARTPAAQWLLRLAASVALLAIGGAVGYSVGTQRTFSVTSDTGVPASAATTTIGQLLQTTLEKQPSGTLEPTAPTGTNIRVKSSFKSHTQQYCREYVLSLGDRERFGGVACRTPDHGWLIEHQVRLAASGPSAGNYAPAAGKARSTLDTVVDAMITGGQLDPDEERLLIENAWRGAPVPR